MKIESIVKVDITRETVSKTVRDLQTTAILSVHTRFADTYREYSGTMEMLEDGFSTTDFAYIAAQRLFSQNPQPAKVIIGKAVDDPVDGVDYVADINILLAANSQWFFLITDADDDADKEAIADFIETQDLFYVTSDSNPVALTTATTDIGAKLAAKNITKTLVLFSKDSSVIAPEAAYVGRFSTAVIGSNLWGYKTLIGLTVDALSSTEIANLRTKNIQFYTKVGADDVIAGKMAVPNGEMILVVLGAIWLKVRIAERYWNLLYTNDRILYTNDGIDMFKAELYSVLSEAVTNNILTNDTPFTIIVPDANKLTPQQRASGVLSNIKFRARLAGAIIYVDGVQGTVYP